MAPPSSPRANCGTLIIGGGQAGLATAQQLLQLNEDVQVLEATERPGDAWRQRWVSLRLFTPAEHDGLPGMPFPATRGSFPTRDQMADYLAAYAGKFNLPVFCGIRVTRVSPAPGGFAVQTEQGTLRADRVVLATGGHALPRIPFFGSQLDPSIFQLHSSQYREPSMIPEGEVLVVGAGTSGAEIALELAKTHRTHLAGKPTPQIPAPVLRYASRPYWWVLHHLLTVRTPVGRKARPHVRSSGAPLLRVTMKEVAAAGVQRHPRVTGVRGGVPVLAGDRLLPVRSVIWATGYRPDFSWVDAPIADEAGWPKGERGVSSVVPGLYFVGMLFQYGLTSGLIGGVGRDAAHVAQQIRHSHAAPLPADVFPGGVPA